MNTQAPDFDSIKQVNAYGAEYWSARDLQPLLGYEKSWQNFEHVIAKAKAICEQCQQPVTEHFRLKKKTIPIGGSIGGKRSQREITDYLCTRYALHLILMTADIKKNEILQILAYFSFIFIDKSSSNISPAKDLRVTIPTSIVITKEQITIGQIVKAFKHIHTIRQYKVLSYAVDLYFPQYRIAVECDEDGHRRYTEEAEMRRQKQIEKALQCKFIRYNPDAIDFNIGDVIHEIMMLIEKQRRYSYAKATV